MSLPTINDVQAVEPVLNNLLIGYRQAADDFVASKVFPGVSVPHDSGTYYIFDKRYWFSDAMKRRAPGGDFATADFGTSSGTYSTIQWALSFVLADEVRANSLVPMDLETAAIQWLALKSLIRKEIAFSTDFMATSVWGTDGSVTAKFSDYAASDPVTDILAAKRTIRANTGANANMAVCGEIVEHRLLNHPDLIDRMKYQQVASMGNVQATLGSALGLDLVVGRASYNATNEYTAMTSGTAIIDDDILICYSAPAPGIFTASAGYTFYWPGGGGLGIVRPTYRNEANDADVIKTKEQWDQVAVATDLGYFYSDCTD